MCIKCKICIHKPGECARLEHGGHNFCGNFMEQLLYEFYMQKGREEALKIVNEYPHESEERREKILKPIMQEWIEKHVK